MWRSVLLRLRGPVEKLRLPPMAREQPARARRSQRRPQQRGDARRRGARNAVTCWGSLFSGAVSVTLCTATGIGTITPEKFEARCRKYVDEINCASVYGELSGH